MKKRLLSLILAVLLSVAMLLPLVSTAVEAAESATYPSVNEDAYNALYVNEGLVFAMDFFKMNPYWNTDGTEYKAPVGPSENSAFEYKGVTYDFTKPENRRTFRVTLVASGSTRFFEPSAVSEGNPNGVVSTPTTEYPTEKAAEEAIKTFPKAPEGMSYGVELSANNAFLAAQSAWASAERAWLAQFTRTVDSDIYAYSYRPALAAGRTDFTNNSNTQYSAFRADAGFLKMRTDYHSSGGFQISNILNTGKAGEDSYKDHSSDSLTLQMVTAFSNDLNATGKVPFLYLGIRPVVSFEKERAAITFTGFASNSDFLPIEGATLPKDGTSLTLTDVNDYTMTLTGGKTNTEPVFSLRLHDRELYSIAGTYKGLSESFYFGWSDSAKNAELYALRQYNVPLSTSDLRQNHLADLCKFFRLDISPLIKDGEVSVNRNDIAALAVLMSSFTLRDSREDVEAAFRAAMDAITLKGEGDAFDTFVAAANAALVDASPVRALPEELRAEIYTAFKVFRDANPTADAEACQAAVDAAVNAVLAREYPDYYGKTPALTADEFFADIKDLSEAALRFAKVAAAFSMDMTPLVETHPVIREYVYESFADLHPDILSLTPVLAARLDAAIETFTEEHYSEMRLSDLVSFKGYQLRLFGDPGIRALFEVNEEAIADLEEHGYTVTLGVLYRINNDNDMTIEKTEDGWVAATPETEDTPAELHTAYRSGTDGSFIAVEGDTCMAFEKTTSSTLLGLYFTAYAVVEREGSEPLLKYTKATSETFGDAPTLRKLATYCREEMSTTAPVIQFLCQKQLTSIYVDGENLTDRRLLAGSGTTETAAAFFDAIKTATGTSLLTVDDAADAPSGVIRLVAGDVASIALADGDIVFTHTNDIEADLAAFAAAIEAAKVKLTVGTKQVDISLFGSGHTFAAE